MSLSPPHRYWLTGAGSGLGAALAEELLNSGAHVALSSRAKAPLDQLAARFPGQVLVVAGDLTNSQTVREIGKQIGTAWGALDTLIVNAGTCEYVDARQFDTSIIEHVVRTNLLASSYCIETALPLFRAGRTPHLVGIASAVTYLPMPRAEALGTSKAGLRYLFESVRLDLLPEGIDVTVVSPGFDETPLSAPKDFPMPLSWSAEKAARHIFAKLDKRQLEIAFPALFIATLWPLSKLPNRAQLKIGKRMLRSPPPQKDGL